MKSLVNWPAFTVMFLLATTAPGLAATSDMVAVQRQANKWRAEHRLIDLHQHINATTQHVTRAVKIMDAVGVGVAVNLSGGTVTRPAPDQPSEFERNKHLMDALFPGRFLQYMNLDYGGWDEPDFAERAAQQIEEGHRLGAAGFKEYKRLGLTIRDRTGKAVKIDDPKLDLMWAKCGVLNMPVSIHVADPKAFWEPYNPQNERWKELGDHPNWWFGDMNKYAPRMELLEALDRVIARHPKTKFVCVHFANNAEDLDWVERALDRRPNMYADLAARIPEIGRHDPDRVRRLFVKHQDRILFATDFQVYNKLILGSSGNEPPPTDADGEVFFAKHWRWLETRDKHWSHMTPIQGDWTISSIGLPAPVLRKIYFDNARKLLARSLPLPVVQARRISQDFEPNGELDEPVWHTAKPVTTEYSSGN
jgi:predicted TIM-barrel fold metal-dependent hydrolase